MNQFKYPDIAKEIEPYFTIDESLADKTSKYIRAYITTNNRLDFFSSSLLGVHPITMTDDDIDSFLSIFNLSISILNSLTINITDIDKNFKVQRNSLHIFIGSLLSLVEKSRVRDKKKFQKDIIFFLVMRIFTSRYNHDFKTLRPPEASKRVYNAMSNSFDIKKYKTNLGVIQNKVESIYSKNVFGFRSNKTHTYSRFIIDVRGKTVSYINGWWTAYNKLSDKNFIETTSSLKTKGEDGTEMLRDVVDITAQQTEMSLKLIYGNLVDKDILMLVHEVITPTTPVHLVEHFARTTMEVITELTKQNQTDIIKQISDSIVSASVNYIYGTRLYPPYTKDVVILGKHIHVIWKSSNIHDDRVKFVKQWFTENIFPKLNMAQRASSSAMTSFLCYFYLLVVIRAEE